MNTFPMLKGNQVISGCGRQALSNIERYFWQSRMTVDGARAEPLELTNIPQLALDIRTTWSARGILQ